MARETVKFINAALDESESGSIILRGVLSPESFELIRVGPYQREILPTSRVDNLMLAFEHSSVPDIELGMRGGGFLEKDGSTFYLQDDTYVIDGLQRISAGKRCIKIGKVVPRLGAVVHFNTTENWERERFRVLNTVHTRLSPNVILRNMGKDYDAIELLQTLCKDSNFILGGKVCWNQRMTRGELISAATLLKSVGFLHAKFGAARTSSINELVPSVQRIYTKLGRGTLRDNIKAYWQVMDECFHVKTVTIKEAAAYLKTGFIFSLAEVFSDHANFWDDAKLTVSKDLRRKLALFPINDPEVGRLASAGGPAGDILYELLVKHINSGKRTNKLVPSRKEFKPAPRNSKKYVAKMDEL